MKALSVIELSQLYGMNRQSIYKRINKGDLS
ncbi:DNA-binding protein, partial [Acinetobacter baumannii]